MFCPALVFFKGNWYNNSNADVSPIGGIIINTLSSIWSGLDWSQLTGILISVIPALICITFHELCHGLVAHKLGDNTAKDAGRLTLNPIKHIDIIGLAMMAIVGFGWAKPVPVNMNNFKKPKQGMAITALAGPVSNMLLAIAFLFIFGLLYYPLYNSGSVGSVVLQMIQRTAYLSCALAVFNIIPLPPLDGSKVLFALLPDDKYYKLMYYERYGMIILMVIVFTGTLTSFLTTGASWVYNGLFVFAQWGSLLTA